VNQLWHPSLETRWKEVLAELEVETKRIVRERESGKEVSSIESLFATCLSDRFFLPSVVPPFYQMVPRLPFSQIKAGKIDPELKERIFKTGSVIIEGAVSEEVRFARTRMEDDLGQQMMVELVSFTADKVLDLSECLQEALKWKADILEYARINKEHVRGSRFSLTLFLLPRSRYIEADLYLFSHTLPRFPR